MSSTEVVTIYTDGAARGNPGPAAFAYVILRDGSPPLEEGSCLGRMTNNQAEYTALVRALTHAAELGTDLRLVIRSDSELMVKQMRGEYRVKNEDLRDLYEQAQALRARFKSVTFEHVRREQNRRADELCNEALDGVRNATYAVKPPPPVRSETPAPKPAPSSDNSHDPAGEEALACLREAAIAWARGNPRDPAPEEIWERISSIVKPKRTARRSQKARKDSPPLNNS